MTVDQKKKVKKTLLVVGGVLLSVVVICGVAYVLNKHGLTPLTKAHDVIRPGAEPKLKLPPKPSTALSECSKVVPAPARTTSIIRGSLDKDALETSIVDIAAHKSRLPQGKHASEAAKELARSLNVNLAPNETMVRDFSRAQWTTPKSA